MTTEFLFRTCRHCKVNTLDTNLMKYSTRHYIHPKCAIEKWGAGIVNHFPLWMLEQFPYLLLKNAGILETMKEYVIAAKAGQRTYAMPGGNR